MFNLEAYEVVGFDGKRDAGDREDRRVSSEFCALVECRSLWFPRTEILKGELHSCCRSHFVEKRAFVFPQLFVDVFSRESPKIVIVWAISSIRSHVIETYPERTYIGCDLL